jgi:hypothetical protein
MLDGLDDVPWARLTHAGGAASNVPKALRAIARGEERAVAALFGTISQQGMVYDATGFVVPFLIELLDAPSADVPMLLALLQAIADDASPLEVREPAIGASEPSPRASELARDLAWRRSAHDAVMAGVPTFLRLLAADDERTRAEAAHTLASCRPRASAIVPSLLARAAVERGEVACASFLLAIGDLGEPDVDAIARWLDDPRPAVRLAAALTSARGARGGDLPATLAEVIRDSAPASLQLIREIPFTREAHEPLVYVIEALGEHWRLQVALLTAWMRDPTVEVRHNAVLATESVTRAWRPSVEPLVRELARSLSDPDDEVRESAARQLVASGRSVRLAVDQLAAVVEREPRDTRGPASLALEALCKARDPRGARHVRTTLESLAPPARGWLRVVAAIAPTVIVTVPPGLTEALGQIGPWADGCLEPLVRLLPRMHVGSAKVAVIQAIARHGDAAAAAVPAISAALDDEPPHAALRALGDLGPVAAAAYERIVPWLRDERSIVRVHAARAVWRVRGDADLALPVLRRAIVEAERSDAAHPLEVAAEMGRAARSLADVIVSALDSEHDWVSARAAIALWRVTGETDRAVPVLVARHLVCEPRGLEALRCLAEIGPPARAAAPLLERSLRSERRDVRVGGAGTWIEEDEAWLELCGAVLEAIERGGYRSR